MICCNASRPQNQDQHCLVGIWKLLFKLHCMYQIIYINNSLWPIWASCPPDKISCVKASLFFHDLLIFLRKLYLKGGWCTIDNSRVTCILFLWDFKQKKGRKFFILPQGKSSLIYRRRKKWIISNTLKIKHINQAGRWT